MQTIMIDLPAVAPMVPQGKGIAGDGGQSFAQFFDKLPGAMRTVAQEEGMAGLLAALTSGPDDVMPMSDETALLESLLKDSSQLDPELRTALELGLQEGAELSTMEAVSQVANGLPVAVAPEVANGLPMAVVPEVAGELLMAAEHPGAESPLGVAETLPAAIHVGEVAVSPVVKWGSEASASAKELSTDTDKAPAVAVMPKVESGQRQKPESAETPPLLDNMLEKMLGQAAPDRRQMITARNESGEQGQRQEMPFDPSIKAGIEVRPTTAEVAAPGNINQAMNSLLQAGNESTAVVAESSVAIETDSQGGQVLTARQAAMPDPVAAPGAGLRLSSGLLVPEERIVDQVVGRLSIGRGRESSMTMKLSPEELGEVKLSLLVEKEAVKAQFVVQSQQVQEVLDRHLPRLRDALAQQGLKLEDVQVSVDSRQGDGSQGLFQDQHQASTPFRFAVQRDGTVPAVNELPVQHGQGPMKSGLSIRI